MPCVGGEKGASHLGGGVQQLAQRGGVEGQEGAADGTGAAAQLLGARADEAQEGLRRKRGAAGMRQGMGVGARGGHGRVGSLVKPEEGGGEEADGQARPADS